MKLVKFVAGKLKPQLIVVKNTSYVQKFQGTGLEGSSLAGNSPSIFLTKLQKNKLDHLVLPSIATQILSLCVEKATEFSIKSYTEDGEYRWPPVLKLRTSREIKGVIGSSPENIEICRTGLCRSVIGLNSFKTNHSGDCKSKPNFMNMTESAHSLAKETVNAFNMSTRDNSHWFLVSYENGDISLNFRELTRPNNKNIKYFCNFLILPSPHTFQ